MRAMILAAGRGERLRPITNFTPKPLIPIGNKPLMQYLIEALVAAGVTELVVNLSWLGHEIKNYFGNGGNLGVEIYYSEEDSALETGGGIQNALHALGKEPFIVVNGDIWTDYPFGRLTAHSLAKGELGHLVMVDTPPAKKIGDFVLRADGKLIEEGPEKMTFSGISLLTPELFSSAQNGAFPLRKVLVRAMRGNALTAEHYKGLWRDIGTIESLQQLDEEINGPIDCGNS